MVGTVEFPVLFTDNMVIFLLCKLIGERVM